MLSRNTRRWLLVLAVLLLASLLIAPSASRPLSAQALAFTPTYQVSISQYSNLLPGSEFSAFGFMVGLDRSGGPWIPHLWVQRYRATTYGGLTAPVEREKTGTTEGWILSLGPAIEFLDTGPWTGTLLPEVILGAPGGAGNVDSGVGVHMGLKGGFFIPQLFGRVQTHGSGWFWTLGVGVTMEVAWDPTWGDAPDWH